ncbi:MAG: acyltransferase, partial [Chloroflexota bacterium]
MKRIDSISFLRFVAAFIVIMFHYGGKTQLAKAASPLITSGPQIVSIFFVLTGFVLMVAYYHRENNKISDFYIARVARIIPVYWIALAMIIHWTYNTTSTMNGWKATLLNFTFMQAWLPPYPLSLNYPGWALSVEVLFYLIFPFVLWGIKKSNISWKNLAILALLLYFVTQATLMTLFRSGYYAGFPSVSHDLMFYFPLVHLCSFILGVSGGYIYVNNMDRFNQRGIAPTLILIFSLLLNFYLLQFPDSLPRIAG